MIKQIKAFGNNYLAAIFTLLILFSGFQSHSQIAMFHAHNQVAPDTLLLDAGYYPNASVAYGFIKYRTAYTGNCILVRRSSDNTTLNIGFVGIYLDTAAMKAFVGSNNGFIQTWYDQSENGNNATQGNTGQQPRIITSGVVERDDNGNVAARFIDASGATVGMVLNLTSIPYSASSANIWTFNVVQPINAGFFAQTWGSTANTRGFQVDYPASGRTFRILTQRSGGLSLGTSTATYTDGVAHLRVDAANRTNLLGWVNNTSVISAADSNTDFTMPTTTNIGNAAENAITSDHRIVSLIMYTSNQSSNRTGIQTKLNNYFSIY